MHATHLSQTTPTAVKTEHSAIFLVNISHLINSYRAYSHGSRYIKLAVTQSAPTHPLISLNLSPKDMMKKIEEKSKETIN